MLIDARVLITRIWRDRKHWYLEAQNGSDFAKAVVKGIDIVMRHIKDMIAERRGSGLDYRIYSRPLKRRRTHD